MQNKIENLLFNGKTKEALKEAKTEAITMLVIASGIYLRSGNLEKAVNMMQAAVMADPTSVVAHANLCTLLSKSNRLQEAYQIGKKGIVLPDASEDMFYNYGVVCKNINLLPEAITNFRKVLEFTPEDVNTHALLADVLLATGNFEEGLKEDEYRKLANPVLKRFRKKYIKPDWNQEPNKRVVVWSEQGCGDLLQNARYLKNLKDLGCYVILEAQESLVTLFANHPWVDEVVIKQEGNKRPILPEYDFLVSSQSLALFFDPKLENTVAEPYIWVDKQEKIPNSIGIVWAGSQWHTNDRVRSCPLKYFSSLSRFNLFSLQKGDMRRTWLTGTTALNEGDDNIEVVNLLEGSEVKYTDWSNLCTDFKQTALLISKLSLVITVDTAVAHLAGALGVKTWLLLPYGHDWRWRKQWYASMTKFKQKKVGDWDGLLTEIGLKLRDFVLE